MPSWDSTIRHGKGGVLLRDSNPVNFDIHCKEVSELTRTLEAPLKIVLVKSWNEWAEGNMIEPTLVNGDKYLKIFKSHFELKKPHIPRNSI
jgi:hypothetical protein